MIKAAGAIIYRRSKGFLLLKKKDFWEFPKGRVDDSDGDLLATALREVHEETSLTDLDLVSDFHAVEHYKINGEEKTVDYFLCLSQQNPTISSEHLGFAWCSADEVLHMLSFESKKKIFKDALTVLREKGLLRDATQK
jgi:8-oxo-dGTP pyrophosphatase MutT (NUDIX family)